MGRIRFWGFDKMIQTVSICEIQNRYGRYDKQIYENKSMIANDELQILKTIWNFQKPINAMEIGIRKGFTAQFLIEDSPWLKTYIGVDVPCDYITSLVEQRWEVLTQKALYVKKREVLDLRVLPNGSFDLKSQDLPKLNFIFIDGDHSVKGVINDSLLAIDSLDDSGVIFWHDYKNVKSVSESLCYLQYRFNWDIKYIEGTYLCYMEK